MNLQTKEISQESLQYCKKLLPKVSRTFALNIGALKGDLYHAVLVGYLFCRIIDTIEDSTKLTEEEKNDALTLWANHFPFGNDTGQLESFLKYGSETLTDNEFETELLLNTHKVLGVFNTLPENYQSILTKWVSEMAKGMALFQLKTKNDFSTQHTLKTTEDLEEYCYYVAGTVGKLLSELFIASCKKLSDEQRNILEENAVAFGLGLQLTNILKDIQSDEKRNWSFIPEDWLKEAGIIRSALAEENNLKIIMNRLIQFAASYLDKALLYSITLPKNEKEIRLFCFLPLHFAIQTLALIKRKPNYKSTDSMKISRAQVQQTITLVQIFKNSNFFQKRFYSQFRKKL